jgi:hypothetical protein
MTWWFDSVAFPRARIAMFSGIRQAGDLWQVGAWVGVGWAKDEPPLGRVVTRLTVPENPRPRGLVIDELIAPLAHLQLGRGYAMSSTPTKPAPGYQDFLTLGKDPMPILKEGKSEYAKVQ